MGIVYEIFSIHLNNYNLCIDEVLQHVVDTILLVVDVDEYKIRGV